MRKKDDLSAFERGFAVGARRAGVSKKLLIYWDFITRTSLQLTENSVKKMSFYFCFDIQMVGSKSGVNKVKAWIHPVSYQWFSQW